MEGNPQVMREESEQNNSLYVRMSRTTRGGSKNQNPMCVSKTRTFEEMGSWESGVNGDRPPALHMRKSELVGGVDVGQGLAILPPTTPNHNCSQLIE